MSNLSENTGYPTIADLMEDLRLEEVWHRRIELLRFIQAERQVLALETIALAQAGKGAVFEKAAKDLLGAHFQVPVEDSDE